MSRGIVDHIHLASVKTRFQIAERHIKLKNRGFAARH